MQQQQTYTTSLKSELKQLTKALTLTPDQQTQVKAVLTDRNQQIEALFQRSMPASREAMAENQAAVKTVRSEAQTKIDALLTDDQKTKYAAWNKKQAKAEARQVNGEMPPPGDGGPPPGGGGGPGGPGGGPGGGPPGA
jgi:Spy/CpxP family protein refolding chaperone